MPTAQIYIGHVCVCAAFTDKLHLCVVLLESLKWVEFIFSPKNIDLQFVKERAVKISLVCY